MKATKQMKPSTTREINAGTSIFKKSSSVLQGSSPSNSKIKRKIKFLANESEPLVLGPPSPGESMVKYSIPIPSENKPDMIDELQMLKDITDHLNERTNQETGFFQLWVEGSLWVSPLFLVLPVCSLSFERISISCFLIFCFPVVSTKDQIGIYVFFCIYMNIVAGVL
uniref:Uncharacterized protein n=1 Tax=Gopherus agassizii TaxID=38772 RepID=A0A452IGC2_9SAUR